METVITNREFAAMNKINKMYLANGTAYLNPKSSLVKSLTQKGLIKAYYPGAYTPTMAWAAGSFKVADNA